MARGKLLPSQFDRGRNVYGRTALTITNQSFEAMEDYIRWAETVPSRMPYAMNLLTHLMAMTNQGIAQQMSSGVYDPQNKNPSAAWRVPVRQISQRFFYGWKVMRVTGGWMLYNDSREAFYIEFGIHQAPHTGTSSARRIRRPVRKLSLRRTLTAMQATGVYHRVWAEIYVGSNKSQRFKGFSQTVQSPAINAAASGIGIGV